MVRQTKKSVNELLLEQGLITQHQWELVRQQTSGGRSIREALIDMKILSEEELVSFISSQMHIPRIDVANQLIDPNLIKLIPEELAYKYQIIPVLKLGQSLTCAMADVFNIVGLDEVQLATSLTIEPAIALESEIKSALDEHYAVKGDINEVILHINEHGIDVASGPDDVAVSKLKGMSEDPPIVKLVNMLVIEAVKERASDVHIEPEKEDLKIRFRIDGVLVEQNAPSKQAESAIVSRIKILAHLDIAERRRPQDGRFHMNMGGKQIDIRVSIVPTIFGENVVMRILDSSSLVRGMNQIGLENDSLENFQQLLQKPNGIILVTGPTGSGKTTTLYAALSLLNTVDKNIITIEDPVEYHLERVRQIQVNNDVDLTFSSGLRSVLRQDPDIIMVGEIRDLETAEIAIQAALTGHLVLSTLHTNDAPGAITRLVDMGIEPFLISSSLIGIIAQRLVRKICDDCKGEGCSVCQQTGFKGRVGVYELMPMDDEVRRLTNERSSKDVIREAITNAGMRSLRHDGMLKVEAGITTQEEVLRVTIED